MNSQTLAEPESDTPASPVAPTAPATPITLTLFQVGGGSQFAGTFSEPTPTGDPGSISRSFKCVLSTTAPIATMSNATCGTQPGGGGTPFPTTQTAPVFNVGQKSYLIAISVPRPPASWPATIEYRHTVQVTFS